MKKVCRLSETVDGSGRAEWITPLELHKGCFEHCPDYLLEDDSLFDELEAPEEWFSDKRIGKWSEYRNGLTRKDLSEMYERVPCHE